MSLGMKTSGVPPISRNLTSTYMRYRNNRRGGGGGVTGDGNQSQRLMDADSDPRAGIEMSALPPQWVDSAQEARDDLKAIRDKLKELGKAQHKRLLKVFGDEGEPDKEVMAIFQHISMLVKRCEQAIHQVKTRGAGSGGANEQEFRLNVQRGLATQLQEVSQEFRNSQKEYLSKMQKRKGDGGLWDDSSTSASSSSSRVDVGFSDGQLMELESLEQNASQRSSEVIQIASSISDLHTIFKELAVLVIDQGSILDRIDYNIEQVVHQSQEANVQLQKAVKSQKSNRAMKCILFLVLFNVVMLLVLILKSRH